MHHLLLVPGKLLQFFLLDENVAAAMPQVMSLRAAGWNSPWLVVRPPIVLLGMH